MTKTLDEKQVAHAEERIAEAVNARMDRWVRANPPPTEKTDGGFHALTPMQKLEAIRNGTAKLRDGVGRYTYLLEAFEFPVEAHEAASMAFYERKKAEYRAKLDREVRFIMDNLLLTRNGVAALAAIKAFVNERDE